ncbi:hypothetical protein Pmani_026454 [Petrolisthes manimaculis]|uniref:Uncharacterized protein n=1 Tax=Petrolisthes manimaculis TaxID=1843537 RepID=A0AAE1P642_9EUCA|nr:hypothetical protein Pmani_026454 [Petrolisthes manimaculis]
MPHYLPSHHINSFDSPSCTSVPTSSGYSPSPHPVAYLSSLPFPRLNLPTYLPTPSSYLAYSTLHFSFLDPLVPYPPPSPFYTLTPALRSTFPDPTHPSFLRYSPSNDHSVFSSF